MYIWYKYDVSKPAFRILKYQKPNSRRLYCDHDLYILKYKFVRTYYCHQLKEKKIV